MLDSSLSHRAFPDLLCKHSFSPLRQPSALWAEDGTSVSAFFLPRHDIFSDSLISLFENVSEEASYVLPPPLLKISSPLSSIPPVVFVPQIFIYWSHLEFTIIFRGTGSRDLFFVFPRRKRVVV